MPGQLRTLIMNYYFGSGVRRASQTFVPDQQALALYSSKAVAGCEKARSKLGYKPQFDFHSGMALTSQYLKWAYADVLGSVIGAQSEYPITEIPPAKLANL
jgi:hypothetical protein